MILREMEKVDEMEDRFDFAYGALMGWQLNHFVQSTVRRPVQ